MVLTVMHTAPPRAPPPSTGQHRALGGACQAKPLLHAADLPPIDRRCRCVRRVSVRSAQRRSLSRTPRKVPRSFTRITLLPILPALVHLWQSPRCRLACSGSWAKHTSTPAVPSSFRAVGRRRTLAPATPCSPGYVALSMERVYRALRRPRRSDRHDDVSRLAAIRLAAG